MPLRKIPLRELLYFFTLVSVSFVHAEVRTLGAFYFQGSGSLTGNVGTGVDQMELVVNGTTPSQIHLDPLTEGKIDEGTYLVRDGVMYLDRTGWKNAQGENLWAKTEVNKPGPFTLIITAAEDSNLILSEIRFTHLAEKGNFKSSHSIFYAAHDAGSVARSSQGAASHLNNKEAVARFSRGKAATGNVVIPAGQSAVLHLRFNTTNQKSQHIIDELKIRGISESVNK